MGQAPFENFDFFVKVKGPLGQSIFYFIFIVSGGSDSDFQVGQGQTGSVGQMGQNRGVEDDVIYDIIALGACLSAWRVKGCE